MSKNPYEEIILGSSRQAARHTINKDFTYSQILQAVANGMTYEWVLENMRPVGQPNYIMKDLYERAVQEHWETSELLETEVGKLLYV